MIKDERTRSIVTNLLLTTALTLLVSCATPTKFVQSWKDPSFSADRLQKILVLGVGLDQKSNRLLEDALVENLAKRHVQATAAYTLVSGDKRWDEAGLKDVVKKTGFDAVVVSRLVDIKTIEREVAPAVIVTAPAAPYGAYGHGYYGYYNASYRMADQPGYLIKEKFAVVDTRLFDAKTEKLLWSGDSRTQVQENAKREDLIREFAGVTCKVLFAR